MKEKLYTIPVNDAFLDDCECPLCLMIKTLETNAIEFTMGPSYMEDDIREETDKVGFCNHHLRLLYENQNRLGLALILKTHMDKTIQHLESLSSNKVKTSASLFKKKQEPSAVASYIKKLESSCFICSKINTTFERYIATIFSLYKNDDQFRSRFSNSKGFCTSHYGLLYEEASKYLNGNLLEQFINELNDLYFCNIKRVKDDLEWFIDKFDYRNNNEPWKNSKDALPRSITKTNSIL
ncbi:DUF6062 family protein [Anaerocolumna sp.]|uniref:DUF6062 family protein n=1 Tax=Anaerocolumna sp. TaxID=2041569 RepID=UPI0028B1D53B|nr:DUF6062 family protein [Anaerocolumna sp.]